MIKQCESKLELVQQRDSMFAAEMLAVSEVRNEAIRLIYLYQSSKREGEGVISVNDCFELQFDSYKRFP
jgi:hypothetical protein